MSKKNFYAPKRANNAINILAIDAAEKILNKKKCIVVTGVTGQDGSHMVDYLLKNTKDFIIFGGVRRLSIYNHKNIKHIDSDRFHIINFDLTDSHAIHRIFDKLQPSFFINFAAQSYVGCSWDFPEQTWHTNTTSIIHILESIRICCTNCRLYQAGSSEEFGNVSYSPQDEKHPLKSRSPYGASKIASRALIKTWRESYNLFAIQGWLYNHEGTRRGEEFITRKISKNVAYIDYCIKNNLNVEPFSVGNIYAKRDWSDAEDFIEGVWKMLNNTEPKEFVLSSQETHTVKEFITKAFKIVNINGEWQNNTDNPSNEKFYATIGDTKTILVQIDEKFYRPAEIELLLGDSSLARKELKWKPKITFDKLIEKMVKNDCKELLII
jgi:GDPmannose 4,6-dehydratase